MSPEFARRGTNRGAGQRDRETPVARLERDARRAALTASPLFQAMQQAELDEILNFASERRVRRGQTIFQRGDNGSALMAVLRGRVRISTVSGDGKEVTLNVISPGEIFGEIALLDGQPRSADASGIEDTLLLVVERRHFLPFLRKNEDLFLRLLAVLCSRLRRTSLALEEIAGLFDLPVRLARVLLKLADDYGRSVSRWHAHRPGAVAARPQQSRRSHRAKASTSSCALGGKAMWWIWKAGSSCCGGQPNSIG